MYMLTFGACLSCCTGDCVMVGTWEDFVNIYCGATLARRSLDCVTSFLASHAAGACIWRGYDW